MNQLTQTNFFLLIERNPKSLESKIVKKMFANHSEFKHLESDEMMIQIGSTITIAKVPSADNFDAESIAIRVQKLLDTQATLLLVFAPDSTNFDDKKIAGLIDVKGPYENGYFLLRLKTGASVEQVKQAVAGCCGQVVKLNGETYKKFAALPLHNPPTVFIFMKVISKSALNEQKAKALKQFFDDCSKDQRVLAVGAPSYDYTHYFVTLNVTESRKDEFIKLINGRNLDYFLISKDCYDKYNKCPKLGDVPQFH